MSSKKKKYEKPELKAVKMLEVGAASCCRTTIAICNNAVRISKSKTLNAS